LRPHDTARLTLDQSIVEGFQSTFTWTQRKGGL
jgi:hypothetical protein